MQRNWAYLYNRPSLEERIERNICGAKKHHFQDYCRSKPLRKGGRCRIHGGSLNNGMRMIQANLKRGFRYSDDVLRRYEEWKRKEAQLPQWPRHYTARSHPCLPEG